MAYRIFFSGLMVYVRYKGYEQVDVLLLNPCAEHHGHEGKKGAHSDSHDEASCTDRHLPQMTIKASDMATWNLAGTLHGCGSRHFDLTGKTVFNKEQVPNENRRIEVPDPERPDPKQKDRVPVQYTVDPFGDMQHLSFETGMVDMCKALGDGEGRIHPDKFKQKLDDIGNSLIAARVRLPAGTLTAFAPLDTSARQVVSWKVGKYSLPAMAETAMFEPGPNYRDNLITIDDKEYVTLMNKPDVAVWITCEPRRRERAGVEAMRRAAHFEHYYELLADGAGNTGKVTAGKPEKIRPELSLSFNTDTPPCPGCQTCAPPPSP